MCDCKSETIRILKRCQHSTDASPPAVSSSPAQGIGTNTIDVSLILAHDLVEHWGKIKNCSNSGSHMTSQTLSCLTDAIKLVLQDYEMAIESMSQSSHPSSNPSGPLIPRVVL